MLALENLMAARYQMALSLGFHIILSCFGVAFPAMIYVVHRRGIRDNDQAALDLAHKWAKAAAVLFAVGAVSGTILSFEMGLLWPELMSTFGDVLGLPFALEGIAFFVEAIFMGIYLYGWNRLPPKIHLRTLIPMIISGVFGTFCVLAVNAWMNAPAGFELGPPLPDGSLNVTDVDPLGAIFNGAVWQQFTHMFVAAYMVAGFVTAAVYAVGMMRGRRDRHHRLGFTVPFTFAAVGAVIQPFIGHIGGMRLASDQPSKLAAMELAADPETRAPLWLGGVLVDGDVRFGIPIPWLGSLISRANIDRAVPGLSEFPVEDRPPANVVHLAFQIMIGAGVVMALIALWFGWRWRRSRRDPGADVFAGRWFLRAALAAGILSVVALESGWTTTEVGRQPWIVFGVMRVEDAVTQSGNIWISLVVIVVVYTAMAVGAVSVLRGMARRWRDTGDVDLPTPYEIPERVHHEPR
ncbi:cytochrome ubiquinol oxidase subunit I [Desertimonas flava]|uniref:cytochrome ubiquinol oxidase subunit I n=1 Tax=Desertimonas flava TaxID=2064846 RepID=UPI001D0CB8B7|nr:cytochrome ubiquinol oxidase subunit I [Desertimonas flava]